MFNAAAVTIPATDNPPVKFGYFDKVVISAVASVVIPLTLTLVLSR